LWWLLRKQICSLLAFLSFTCYKEFAGIFRDYGGKEVSGFCSEKTYMVLAVLCNADAVLLACFVAAKYVFSGAKSRHSIQVSAGTDWQSPQFAVHPAKCHGRKMVTEHK